MVYDSGMICFVICRGGLDSAPDWLREQLPPLDLTQQKHRRRFEDMTLGGLGGRLKRITKAKIFRIRRPS